jgi:hypothetical protein
MFRVTWAARGGSGHAAVGIRFERAFERSRLSLTNTGGE